MINDEKIKEIFVRSIKDFYRKESRFISDRLCERAIVGRIVLYLDKRVKKLGYEVFTEFNKMYQEDDNKARAKILDSGIIQRRTNYPDILVLRCNENMKPCENILVIEAKYTDNTNDLESDIFKLINFTKELSDNDNRQYYYAYPIGGHLFLNNETFIILWYKNGLPVEEDIYSKNGNRFRKLSKPFTNLNYSYNQVTNMLIEIE